VPLEENGFGAVTRSASGSRSPAASRLGVLVISRLSDTCVRAETELDC
jgi:hypothetical protein